MAEFLKSLIVVSEKAANIARACRSEKELFPLLIQEKTCGEANPRFVHDFKTLADVLIQETVRYYIGLQFPALADHIKGEESNVFSNINNETITVEVKTDQSMTADVLVSVLDGNKSAAEILAEEVHKDVNFDEINCDMKEILDFNIDLTEIGIWIDPIDSTAEYISGQNGSVIENNIYGKSLQCVTVLIGAYNLNTGLPVAGVVNQPFNKLEGDRWSGLCNWAVCTDDFRQLSIFKVSEMKGIISISYSENDAIKSKLKGAGYHLVETAGAGYKLLTVAKGFADAYILSRASCYKWDTCGPHALLKACGGAVIEFNAALNDEFVELIYNIESTGNTKDISVWGNNEGIIAFRNQKVAEDLIDILKN